jgi:hypothetical protein
MLLQRAILACVCVAAACGVTQAGVITDPAMALDADSLSSPLTPGINIIPDINGGGIFGFYNPNPSPILELEFQTRIAAGLNPTDVSSAFSCQQSNPFFLGCSIGYIPATGMLIIDFSGEGGAQQGIPTLLPGCASTPDGPGCDTVGHFGITLNYGFSFDGDSGGWSPSVNPELFPSTPVLAPQVINGPTINDATPEPSSLILFGAALLFAPLLPKVRALRNRKET